jgi:4-hydroxybenzoate polyprenyltransferase
VRSLVQLTRWREHLPYDIPLTLLGALLAVYGMSNGQQLDYRLLTVLIANILAVGYAFMINDIEDAPDDARDPDRKDKNPVSAGRLTVRAGYNACRIVAVAAMALYATGGWGVFIIGGITLLLSHLYSWRPVRLKAYPVTDVVSHSLMLSGLIVLAGYFIYHTQPGVAWLVAACVTLFSVYGQLYNQLRDYEYDKLAGLNNTAIILGERNTRIAIWVSIVLAFVCLVASIVMGAFPYWLAGVVAIGLLVSSFFSTQYDMRGTKSIDSSAAIQVRGMVAVNVTVLVWLAAVLIAQFFVQ